MKTSKGKPKGCFRAGVSRPWAWKGGRDAAQKRYKLKHRKAINARNRKWYREHRKQVRAHQIKYQKENRVKLYAYNSAWQHRRNAKVRAEMVAAYGGQCACCGEREPLFLELDHIANDGAAERIRHGNSLVELLALKKAGWPTSNHQLLCSNCNQGKRRNGGTCPHKKSPS